MSEYLFEECSRMQSIVSLLVLPFFFSFHPVRFDSRYFDKNILKRWAYRTGFRYIDISFFKKPHKRAKGKRRIRNGPQYF